MERSLLEVLEELPEFRQAQGKRHKLSRVVLLVVLGLLCGQNSLEEIGVWAQGLDYQIKKRIGNRFAKVASYSTIRRVMLGLDAEKLAEVLQKWVAEILSSRGLKSEWEGLSLDGKTLRGSGDEMAGQKALQVLNAVVHQLGVVVASQIIPTETNELGAMPEFLEKLPLTDRVVTTDALHAQRDQAQTIRQKGGTIFSASKQTKVGLMMLSRLGLPKPPLQWCPPSRPSL